MGSGLWLKGKSICLAEVRLWEHYSAVPHSVWASTINCVTLEHCYNNNRRADTKINKEIKRIKKAKLDFPYNLNQFYDTKLFLICNLTLLRYNNNGIGFSTH